LKAVILAAGEGSRMRPLTYTRPKVMLPIANRPILEHLLLASKLAGIEEFVFIVGYCDQQVLDYFGNGEKWGVRLDYLVQRRQLGTADAIATAADFIQGKFLVMNGDILVKAADIRSLAQRDVATMSLFRASEVGDLGVVETSGDRIVRIHEKVEKPPSNLANAGLYLFTPEIFNATARIPKSPRGEYEITDALQMMINEGQPVSYRVIDYWLDLSYPWDLLTANEALLGGIVAENLGEIEPNVVLKGPVAVGKDTIIRSGSYIVGPVVIGQGCNIGPNCFIRPYTTIGDGCHIGAAVEMKNTIVMKNSKFPHLNYAGDSVIGEGCNFGAGTKIANLRLDNQNIVAGGVNTKRRKLGAIVGDNVETGINACINVGTMIGNNTHIGPGALARGTIAPNSRLF
jgi:UDP-N-acetylglucosamine diphosphorylase/glucosamine-1-phosphate N-acetyltransferase